MDGALNTLAPDLQVSSAPATIHYRHYNVVDGCCILRGFNLAILNVRCPLLLLLWLFFFSDRSLLRFVKNEKKYGQSN